MEEMKNGMNASNENNIAEDLNEVTTENATRTEVNDISQSRKHQLPLMFSVQNRQKLHL